MDSIEFKKDFIESIKTAAAVTGEGSCASFVDNMAQYLIDAEALSDFTPSFYKGKSGRSNYRVDGYVYDEFDNTMNLIIADYDGNDLERRLTGTVANKDFGLLMKFLDVALTTNLYQEIEMSTPCADLVDLLRNKKRQFVNIVFLYSLMQI